MTWDLPIVVAIECELAQSGVSSPFSCRNLGDLYLLPAEQRWQKSERQGRNIELH